MLWIKVDLNILVVFIINTHTNTALAEVLYQRRILNVRTSQGLMDGDAGASHTTGGPLVHLHQHQPHVLPRGNRI